MASRVFQIECGDATHCIELTDRIVSFPAHPGLLDEVATDLVLANLARESYAPPHTCALVAASLVRSAPHEISRLPALRALYVEMRAWVIQQRLRARHG